MFACHFPHFLCIEVRAAASKKQRIKKGLGGKLCETFCFSEYQSCSQGLSLSRFLPFKLMLVFFALGESKTASSSNGASPVKKMKRSEPITVVHHRITAGVPAAADEDDGDEEGYVGIHIYYT